jgi:prepilin-type N-terminal cleavage/methylation domain-containing protein
MRNGFTVIELLVVIAIIAILIGILVPGVQKARESAMMAHSQHNIRQISLGLHHMADVNKGKLPGSMRSDKPYRHDTFIELLPYLEQEQLYKAFQKRKPPIKGWDHLQIPAYLNPLDRSYQMPNPAHVFGPQDPSTLSVSSYALNAQFFLSKPRMSQMIDGASQTIWIAEHYAWNCNGTSFLYTVGSAWPWKPVQPATFAQSKGRPKPGDYVPITAGKPPVSAAEAGKTFQVTPSLQECDPRLPNASSSRGLQIGLGDGSVRIVSPQVSPQIFWGLVTPAGGEVIPHFD